MILVGIFIIIIQKSTSHTRSFKHSDNFFVQSCNKMKYEYLSFIKDDCDKCRNTIFKILSMIPEV